MVKGVIAAGFVVRAVLVIDNVEHGHAALLEGDVVVVDGFFFAEEVVGVAGFLAGFAEQVEQPGRGVQLLLDVHLLPADHVGHDEGLDVADGAVHGPLGGDVADAVELVGADHALAADGLFAVVEEQPDGVALGRVLAIVLAERDEQGGGACAVVGADEVNVLEWVVGFVVAGEDDELVALAGVGAGEFDDVVRHTDRPYRCAGGEGVGDEVASGGLGLEVVADEGLGSGVAGRADEALRCDVDVLLRELEDGRAGDGVGLALRVRRE